MYNSVSLLISGVVSASLAQNPARATEKFRHQLALVLYRNCLPVLGLPPSYDSVHRRRFQLLLDLCLPKTEDGLRRRGVLQESLTGDTTRNVVAWHVSSDVSDAEIWQWAERVSEALYPRSIKVFPRQRWLTSLNSFQEYNLLGVHGLLEQALPRWLDDLEGRPLPPVTSSRVVEHIQEDGELPEPDWHLSESEAEEEASDGEGYSRSTQPDSQDGALQAYVSIHIRV